ncbi:phosphatase PAP2 family protein [Couchioplanes caeruleus]|uniref:Phosphoesterase n=2 Tax=Couchioplanes caeruleus TaxID=56438 RepID=A0A1K0GT23_9ACTN|nr:phosphatase PAP2 family protein [Couchioplanes caeruleus]OJF14380.1 phosphoesterase [Couchioplanes caeruleus subsp. caeruleus]ROP32976.1 undecaprenyl-diphosphatase [Couchioplanes caeruleus]
MVTEQQDRTAAPEPVRARPLAHFAERSLLGLLVVIALGLGFGVLLLLVRGRWGPLESLDAGAADGLNDLVSPQPAVVDALDLVARAGGRPIMMWLVTIAVVALLIRKRFRLAIYLVVTGVGALLMDPSLKALIDRVRPVVDVPVATAPGNSFPSGHALGSMVVYGALLLVFLPAVSARHRKWFITVVAVIVAAIGVTRISLGVHYVSDVLAGWLLGAAWLGVTAYAFRVWRREIGRPEVPLENGLEPEAAADVRPGTPGEHLLPHPWAGAMEILVGWVFVFGLLYLLGWTLTNQTEGTWIGRFDDAVPTWLQSMRTPGWDDVSHAWSKAGDTHAILLVSLVFCPVALAVWRHWRVVLYVVLAMVGELTLFLCTSAAVDRPRPPVEQLDGKLPTSSFPSGHIAATMCLYAAIAVLVLPRLRAYRWRWIFVVLAVIMPLGVGVSRMYRGMHHPTDMLGAALLTAGWLTVLYLSIRPNADVRRDA